MLPEFTPKTDAAREIQKKSFLNIDVVKSLYLASLSKRKKGMLRQGIVKCRSGCRGE